MLLCRLHLPCGQFAIACTLALLAGSTAQAQPTSAAPAQDPLISLMLSQPRIDTNVAVSASVVFDPPVVREGERAIYRLSLNALQDAIVLPGDLPHPSGATVRRGAQGQTLQMVGTNLQPRTSYNFHVRPTAAGKLIYPSFTLKVYGKPVVVPEASLEVLPSAAAPTKTAQVLSFEMEPSRLYTGQPARAKVTLPGGPGGSIQALTQIQINGQGFLLERTANRQRIENGNLVHETTVTPITPGKIECFAHAFAVGHRFTAPITITGTATIVSGPPLFTLLDSDPILVEVLPLPREGQLPGFNGAVGHFRIDPPRLNTNAVRVGEAVRLSVNVRGEGNLARLTPPPAPNSLEWQVFEAGREQPPPQVVQAQGFVTFTFLLVPLTDEISATPAVPYSCFVPDSGKYADLTIPPVPIEVRPGATPASAALLQTRAPDSAQPPGPRLSNLATKPGVSRASLIPLQQRAWFPVLQLAPAAAFLCLWIWNQRRRHLERHPEIVLRRRALRHLRRERRAANRALWRNDAPGFASHALEATRFGAAAHLPAEPRAIVCSDVLGLLPPGEGQRETVEVVRMLFAGANEAWFSGRQTDLPNLFSKQPVIERLLDFLEERA